MARKPDKRAQKTGSMPTPAAGTTPNQPRRPAGAIGPAKRPAVRRPPLRVESLEHLVVTRELFWNNVIREILTSLSTLSMMEEDVGAGDKPAHPAAPARDSPADPLDGRIAVVTSAGERIPIAEVNPLFACGVPGSAAERQLSMAVECTVFQIRTPAGEVYTLPLHEIRGLHALNPELMAELAKAAAGATATGEPFGFAAFTSLARAGTTTPDATAENGLAD